MAFSYKDHEGAGSVTAFAVPFAYLSRSHVHVSVAGVDKAFSWLNAGMVQIVPAPASGALVRIYRRTPTGTLLATFQDGSTLTKTNLDLAALQSIYLAEEGMDDAHDAQADTDRLEERINMIDGTVAVAASNAAIAARDLTLTARDVALAARDAAVAASANAQFTSRFYTTYFGGTSLSTAVGAYAGEVAEVPSTDTGNHTDPITSAVVPNGGTYVWVPTASTTVKWTWVGPPRLSNKMELDDASYPLRPSARKLWAGLDWIIDIQLGPIANQWRTQYVRFLKREVNPSTGKLEMLVQINECDRGSGANDGFLCRFFVSESAPDGAQALDLVTLSGVYVGLAILYIPPGATSPGTTGAWNTTYLLPNRVFKRNKGSDAVNQWVAAQSPALGMFYVPTPTYASPNLLTILQYTKRFDVYQVAKLDGTLAEISRFRFRHFKILQPTSTTAGQILFQLEQEVPGGGVNPLGTILARYNETLPAGSATITGRRTFQLKETGTGITSTLSLELPDTPTNIDSTANTFQTAGIRVDRVANTTVGDDYIRALVQQAIDTQLLSMSKDMLRAVVSGLPTVSGSSDLDRSLVMRPDGNLALKAPYDVFRVKQGINILGVLGTRVPQAATGSPQNFPPLSDYMPGGSRADAIYVRENIKNVYGCDYIRLLFDPAVPMRWTSADRTAIYDRMRAAISYYLAGGLKVLLVNQWYYDDGLATAPIQYPGDGSNYDTVFGPSQTKFAAFRQVCKEVAHILATEYPQGQVCYELMNEPTWAQRNDPVTGWHAKLNVLLDDVRDPAVAPHLPLLIDGSGGQVNGILALTKSNKYDSGGNLSVTGVTRIGDPYLNYSFHFYEPYFFTHQSAGGGGRVLKCVPWPAALRTKADVTTDVNAQIAASSLSTGDKASTLAWALTQVDDYYNQNYSSIHIINRMNDVKVWAAAAGVPLDSIIIGEFGAFSELPLDQDTPDYKSWRVAWNTATIQAARNLGVALCYWTNYLKEDLATLYNGVP